MMMKKKVLSVAVAGAFLGAAGMANAVMVEEFSNGTPFAQSSGSPVGQVLIVPYFTTQNGNSTLINIVNTDTINGKAVKVRFRGGVDSDDIFDFQIFMSPGDMWTANLSQNSSGLTFLTTSDNSCTLPSKSVLNSTPFITARLGGTSPANNAGTLEGYAEIFVMADVPPPVGGIGPWAANFSAMTAAQQAATLFGTTKHTAGVPTCDNTILTGIEAKGAAATVGVNDGKGWIVADCTNCGGYPAARAADASVQQSEVDAAAELRAPTTGLMANWTIINVPNTTVFSGVATALSESAALGGIVPGATRVVYSQQTSTAVAAKVDLIPMVPAGAGGEAAAIAASDDFPNIKSTFDAVLLSAGFSTAEYDFPDLSTPYGFAGATLGANAGAAGTQAFWLAQALSHNKLVNEFILDPAISGKTDWLVSMPVRRYLVAGRGITAQGVDNTVATGTYKDTVTLADNATDATTVQTINALTYAPDAGGAGDTKTGAMWMFAGVTSYAKDGHSSCVNIGNYSVFDREETTTVTNNVVVSPSTVTKVALCGEVNVLSLNNLSANTGAVGANLSVAPLLVPYANGWASVSLDATGHTIGLPSIGFAFVKAVNPAVSAGVSGTFGGTWKHRF